MSIVVQKYGGSSVASPEKIKEVAQRILTTRDVGHSVVVVVSAMAKTTDNLLELAQQIDMHPHRRELDMLLTTGERISMALLSMAIREMGGEAISFTGSQAGILTNDRHSDARIIEVRPVRVQDELERGKIVIVAGYQGMSYKREITTLGRGGSDTTAIALAAALDAEWCEICSDVDGVYTTDPRVVPEATRIPELSYEETLEMAENGAKVLNARAVEFAAAKEIAIYARATAGPIPGDDPTADGTVVRKSPPREPGMVVGIASQESIYLLTGKSDGLSLVYPIIDQYELSILRSQVEADRFTILFSPENAHQMDAMEKVLGNQAKLIRGYGTVSAVGAGINSVVANLMGFQSALGSAGCEVLEITSVSNRITAIIQSDKVKEATRALHEVLIEN